MVYIYVGSNIGFCVLGRFPNCRVSWTVITLISCVCQDLETFFLVYLKNKIIINKQLERERERERERRSFIRIEESEDKASYIYVHVIDLMISYNRTTYLIIF